MDQLNWYAEKYEEQKFIFMCSDPILMSFSTYTHLKYTLLVDSALFGFTFIHKTDFHTMWCHTKQYGIPFETSSSQGFFLIFPTTVTSVLLIKDPSLFSDVHSVLMLCVVKDFTQCTVILGYYLIHIMHVCMNFACSKFN